MTQSQSKQQPTAKYRHDYQPPDYTITHVDIEFDLFESHTTVVAKSRFIRQTADVNSIMLDGDGLLLKRIEINGQAWSHYTENEDGLALTNLPVEFELVIETEISPISNTSLEGLYLSDGAYCTQCEAEGFRRITYYFDRPDVLAKFTTKITAEKTAFPYLLSNGNKIASGDLSNNRHWVRWQDPFAKPCYLFALVAGNFDVLEDGFITRSGRNVALEIYVDKGNLHRAMHAMQSLKKAMKWDEDRFNLEYDLDTYMIVAVDFFNMGAMENKGLNVFNSKYVLANVDSATDKDYLAIEAVIGHEYFHNWTGNRVTCRDWFQLSLKEGLTVFRDQEFSSDVGSRSVNRINNVRVIRGPQFAEDAGPMAHPIRPEKVIEMNNFYTLTVYEKGSEVIRMMHTLLGEEKFQKGMKLYFDKYDGTAATCDDFVNALESESGIELTQFRLWYSQSGTPELNVTRHYDQASATLSITFSQFTPATADQKEKQPLLIPVDIELYGADGDIIELQRNGMPINNVLHVTQAQQTFIFDNVLENPVISILREFSAPVKLHVDYSDEELVFLMHYARNEFSCWDAGQMLLAKYISVNIERVQSGQDVDLPDWVISAFKTVLLDKRRDKALIAEMLTLPSENEIAGWFSVIDVDAIYTVREGIEQRLAMGLIDELNACYIELKQSNYHLEHHAIATRSLRNVCLSYLALTKEGDGVVLAHFDDANNMTDTMAALSAANQAQLPVREEMMQSFSDKWQDDGLVMDKWFTLQATSSAENALANVKAQMQHPGFSLQNPNRTRSLIAAFCNNNPIHFHAKDGSGYQFLTDILVQLNATNPQLASQMMNPLLKLNRFAEPRQGLMRNQLERLAKLDNLANDLYEKITKALTV